MRLALLVLLLLPAPVYAMPPAIFAAIAAAIGVSAATLTTIVTVVSIALTIGTTVFGAVQQKAASKKAKRAASRAREDFLNSLTDRTVTRIATEAPYMYVYGTARVGSSIVAVLKSGEFDQFKHIVCVHAAHEIVGYEKIWVNGKELGELDADGNVTSGDYFLGVVTLNSTKVSATSPFTLDHTPSSAIKVIAYSRVLRNGVLIQNRSDEVAFTISGNTITVTGSPPPTLYTGAIVQLIEYRVTYQYKENSAEIRVKKHYGQPEEGVDLSLLAECPDKWTGNCALRGFAYTVIRLDLRQAEFQGGLPSVEVLIKGKKLYDPRTGVYAWSDNPALCIYDYLISEMCGVDVADIPTAHIITAANVCEEQRSFGNLYTCNGTATSEQDQANVLEAMAQSMAGSIVATTWEVTAGKYVAPIVALTQADIVGSLAVTPGISDADLFNGVRGQNITAANLYVATDFPVYQNPTYLASDGKDKFVDINFPFTDTAQRVHNLCRILTEDQRNGFTVKAEFSLKAWDTHIGDRVTFTSAFLGQATKVYRVTDKKYSPDSSIELTLKEDGATIWDLADTVLLDDTPNSNLPDPFTVSALSFVTCDSGSDALLIQQDGTVVSRIRVKWGGANGAVITGGEIQIEWQQDNETAWRKTTATGGDAATYLSPVEDGVWYVVRARAFNPYFNVKSDWTYADLHKVIGKSEPPGDIEDLSIDGSILTWTAVTDLDLAGYVFRYHYGSNLDWGTATPLHAGVVTSSPHSLTSLPFGSVTIMGKAVDTSGNESLVTANIFTDLGDAPVANVVETFSFHPTFAGTKSFCTVVGGQLVATAQDSFYGDDLQSFYGSDSLSFYKPSTGYRQMVYTTDEIILSDVLAGSKITLALETHGADVTVEYRLTGEGSFYGTDAAPFYESGGGTASGPNVFDAVEASGFDAFNPDSFAVVDVDNFDPTNPDSFLAVEGFSTVADDSFYGAGNGTWLTWPGQITARAAGYQFRVTIGSGLTPGSIGVFDAIVDAPDMEEVISDLLISASGTVIPYTKNFTVIKSVTVQLQANGSGAETAETDKSNPLAPSIKAYNSSHTAVSGATTDATIRGY